MKAHNLKSPAGATHRSRRVGRGHSAGQGKTSGRGVKGQGARSGGVKPPYFEGGQLPFVRRLPFVRGFVNIHKLPFTPVNVQELNSAFNDGDAVTLDKLEQVGLIKSAHARVKVLGNGELQKKLSVQAHAFSVTAKEKIEKAGGQAEVLAA
ncbi:MAG: 50S ribosomal protein L15 [Chloroflexota bacterium]